MNSYTSTIKAYVDVDNANDVLGWDAAINQFTEFSGYIPKEETMLFNLVLFKTVGAEEGRIEHANGDIVYFGNTIRRCKANVIAITGIVLDIDNKESNVWTIEKFMAEYPGLRYILFTTHRHQDDRHRFRVIIPFSQPLLAEDIPEFEESIKQVFPAVDNASFTCSQAFYYHAMMPGSTATPRAFAVDGYVIDPYNDFIRRPKPVIVPKPREEFTGDTSIWTNKVRKSIATIKDIHYAGGEAGKHGILSIACACKSAEYNEAEYIQFVREHSFANSDLNGVKDAYLIKIYNKAMPLTKAKLREVVKQYGGNTAELMGLDNDWRSQRNSLKEKYLKRDVK